MAINMLKKGKVFSIIFLLVLIDQLTKFVFRDVDSFIPTERVIKDFLEKVNIMI